MAADYSQLSSEHVCEPSSYASVLEAIGQGRTRPGEMQSFAGLSTGSVNHALKGLQALQMVERWIPFAEKLSTTRSIYRLSDPFLMFHTRFVVPNRSLLEKRDPAGVYEQLVKPFLEDYMGQAFERICHQYLRRFGSDLLGDHLDRLSSYWSRDGSIEIDIMGRLGKRRILAGECKWRARQPVGMDVLGDLKRKLAVAGKQEWRSDPQYLIVSSAGFTNELQGAPDVVLAGPEELFPQ